MTINRHLERAGLSARVDHRSLLDRQMAAVTVGDFAKAAELDRQPEPKVGRTATAAARRVSAVRAPNASSGCAPKMPSTPRPRPTASASSKPKPPPTAA